MEDSERRARNALSEAATEKAKVATEHIKNERMAKRLAGEQAALQGKEKILQDNQWNVDGLTKRLMEEQAALKEKERIFEEQQGNADVRSKIVLEEVGVLKEENRRSTERVQELQSSLQHATEQRESALARADAMNFSLSARSAELVQEQETNRAKHAELSATIRRAANLTAELDAATATLQQCQALCKQHEEAQNSMSATLQGAQSEMKVLQTRLECTETELASAHKMIEMVQKARDLTLEEVSVMKGQAEKMSLAMTKRQEQVTEAARRIGDLEKENDELRSQERQRECEEKDVLEKERAALGQEREAVEQDKEALEQEKLDLFLMLVLMLALALTVTLFEGT